MKFRRPKSRMFPGISRRVLRWGIAALIAVGLVVALCISIFNFQNMQNRYAKVQTQLREAVYQNLYKMARRSEELRLAGTDVSGTVLPAMEESFAIAVAFNDAVVEAYGERRAVLSPEDAAALRNGFDAYNAALRGGLSTDQAQAQLTAAVARVAELLDAHYESGQLIPTE